MQITNLANQNIDSSNILDKARGRGGSILRVITANPKISVGVGVVALFVLLAIAAPLLTPYAADGPHAKVATTAFAPSGAHILGTAGRGEDIFAQLLYGARVSLAIGFIAAAGSTALQVLFGLTAGYFGGLIDEVLTLIINVFLVLPGLPLAIVIAALAKGSSGASMDIVITFILLFTSWSYGARVLRAQTLSLREREFVAASRASGETSLRIIFAEILPNEIALVASTFVGTFVYAVGAQVALEFLGLGDITHASWGNMLFEAQSNFALLVGGWWEFVPAGLCVAIICASLTFVNFGIDELANPNLRSEKPVKKLKDRKLIKAEKGVVA